MAIWITFFCCEHRSSDKRADALFSFPQIYPDSLGAEVIRTPTEAGPDDPRSHIRELGLVAMARTAASSH